jgi:hypothetical protein
MKLKKPARRILAKPAPKTALRKPVRAANPSGGTAKGKIKQGGAFDRSAAERKRWEAETGKPFDVSVPIGGSLDVYILDRGEPFYRYEHSVGGSATTRARIFPCLQDTGELCPVCAKEGKSGSYVLYLTAVVPKETYTKKGERTPTTRRFQKKLFPIKLKMQEKYKRLYLKHGSFRGLKLRLTRDGQMDAKTGNDVEVLGRLSEEQIRKFATGESIKGLDKDTKERIKKANLQEPFDYEKVFPTVDAKTLSIMVGAGGGGGDSLGDADFEEDEEDDGWGEAAD